jgi:transcriptional regulator with XRE-family HTH domain
VEAIVAISGPTVVRRQLGRRLQRLREDANVTVNQVEEAGLGSRTKIWRIEAGKVPVKKPDIWALCRFYRVDQDETDRLAALAEGTSAQGWWEDYSDVVPDWFRLYVGLETAAAQIRTFEGSLVPGELQTPDYARAVYRAVRPDDDDTAIERHVKLRKERQDALLARTEPPHLSVVLSEAVLTQQVGGAEVIAEQINHLHNLDRRDHIDIRVLPFTAGAHAAMTGAFRIMDFADEEDPNLVYIEMHAGAHYLEKPGELAEYRRIFELASTQSVPIGASRP